MATAAVPLTQRSAWKALETHYAKVRNVHMRQLFADDAKRGERLCLEAVDLFLDYSKNRVTDETLKLLLQLAEESGLRSSIDAMFRGDKINLTEKRSVLHVALRAPRTSSIVVDGVNVVAEVHTVLDKMAAFSDRIRSGWPLTVTTQPCSVRSPWYVFADEAASGISQRYSWLMIAPHRSGSPSRGHGHCISGPAAGTPPQRR